VDPQVLGKPEQSLEDLEAEVSRMMKERLELRDRR
jgi:hypothetical protein